MTRYRSLDLEDHAVVCALSALDTDLRQFNYVCIEQGPFFKLFFEEFVSDAPRTALQQKPPGLPGCPPHVSHCGRQFWKPQIEKAQILAIYKLFVKFRVQWQELFSRHSPNYYFPAAASTVQSPWTLLDAQLLDLASNICATCRELTDAPDDFLAEPRPTARFGADPRRQAHFGELLHSLAQLSESDSCEMSDALT